MPPVVELLNVALDWLEAAGVSVLVALPAAPGVPVLVPPPLPPVADCVSVSAPVVLPLRTLVSKTLAPLPPLPVVVELPPPLPPVPTAVTLTAPPPAEEPVMLPALSETVPPLPLLPLPLAEPPLPPVAVKPTVTVPAPPDEYPYRRIERSTGLLTARIEMPLARKTFDHLSTTS